MANFKKIKSITKHIVNKSLTIEDWYDLNIENGSAGITLSGHESVKTLDRILNWEDNLYYANVKRIIRHKVSKEKWKLTSKSGKSITVTGDHSLIIIKNNKPIEVKPCDIKFNDIIVTITDLSNMTWSFDMVKQCEHIGDFEDEYVYDIEVDDNTHTFIANDILVHNSTYVNFGPAIKSVEGLNLSMEEGVRFVINIDKNRISSFYDSAFEKWSKKFNTKNRQTFKLENISSEGFWIKKKNYALRVVYEPNPKEELFTGNDINLMIKGLEPIKSSYPEWARNHQMNFIDYLLTKGTSVDLEKELIPMIKNVREEYDRLSPSDIAQNFTIRQYNKYVESEEKGTVKKGATTYPKATIHHNHLIIKNGLEGRYPKLREGNKIKLLYCKPDPELEYEVFAYNPGQYPKEIAPEIDYNQQFFILIVEPINRILGAMGVNEVDINLKRSVEFKTTKSKKPLTESQLFPLHVINSETLEHEEVPEKFWNIINNNEEVPEEIFDEYLEVVTKYGLNSVILINKNLRPYKRRIAKNLGIELVDG